MKIISGKYLEEYISHLTINLDEAIDRLGQIEITPQSFKFYTSVAVISSAKIEGEKMEVDSYIRHKMQDIEYLPELIEKPNDLFLAYDFAQHHALNEANFLEAHKLLSQHLLPEKWRGALRQNEMLIMQHDTGRIQYEAASFFSLTQEMQNLWQDIEELLKEKLAIAQVFYYAAYLHLVFVNLHPFNDGNGRSGRLLEKWFLAQLLGEKAWYIQSEKYYYAHVDAYYNNLNKLGMFYEQLDYSKAGKFLQMLPMALAK